MTSDQTVTARRIGGKVRVTLPDGTVKSLGGARVARASALVVARHPKRDRYEIVGLRADAGAAAAEAARLVRQTELRTHGCMVQVVPYTWAVAVPVEDLEKFK